MNRKLFANYNQPNTLVVVSSYPPKGEVHGEGVGGLASFSKNTLKHLLPLWQSKIVVLAECFNGKREVYEDEGILVIRCWNRNSLTLYLDLLKEIVRFSRVNTIKIQFEFSIFGDLLVTGFFPLFLFLLRILGKETCLVIHQVLTDLKSLSGHLGIKEKSFKLSFFSKLNCLYYCLLSLSTKTIVVLEEEFKKRLKAIGIKSEKIVTIPHGVDCSLAAFETKLAKKTLNISNDEFVVLVFGFLTWYKGSDLAVEAFKKSLRKLKAQKLRLVLAGGESVTQNHRFHYQEYLRKLYSSAAKTPQILITGFVPESRIKTYFSAADLVLLPYRTFMSSSGVLSLTLSYLKPFLVSSALKGWFANEFKDKVHFFSPSVTSLSNAIVGIVNSKKEIEKLCLVSGELREQRDFGLMAAKYKEVLTRGKATVFNSGLLKLSFRKWNI